MTTLRMIAIILSVAAVLTLALGTFGVTQTAMERGVSVEVVSDQEAFIGVKTVEEGTTGTESTGFLNSPDNEPLVKITNGFSNDITIKEVRLDGTNADPTFEKELDSGGSTVVEAPVCKDQDGGQLNIGVTVKVDGPGISATLFDGADRQVIVDCPSPSDNSGNETDQNTTADGEGDGDAPLNKKDSEETNSAGDTIGARDIG